MYQMKFLVVMVHYPFPPKVGSAIVAFNCLKYLSRQHVIDYIGFRPPGLAPAPDGFLRSIELLDAVPRSRFNRWFGYMAGVFSGVPDSVSRYKSTSLEKRVEEVIEKNNYDAILLFEMAAIQYCPASSYGKVVANIEDPQSIKLRRSSKLNIFSFWRRAFFFIFSHVAKRYERRVLPLLGKVLLLSKSDIDEMRRTTGNSNLEQLPYGVTLTDESDIVPYVKRANAIVYSGNMFHLPNVDGALFLLREVYPEILRQCPNAVLWIVGAQPDERIFYAAKRYGSQVAILANVDDVAKYIKLAKVSVCPVRLRIGVQTKVLEAMSWGTPVVTTSAGNSGVGASSGLHLWIEDTPVSMAMRICELLRGQAWDQLSQGGAGYARDNFSWERNIYQFEAKLALFVEANK